MSKSQHMCRPVLKCARTNVRMRMHTIVLARIRTCTCTTCARTSHALAALRCAVCDARSCRPGWSQSHVPRPLREFARNILFFKNIPQTLDLSLFLFLCLLSLLFFFLFLFLFLSTLARGRKRNPSVKHRARLQRPMADTCFYCCIVL